MRRIDVGKASHTETRLVYRAALFALLCLIFFCEMNHYFLLIKNSKLPSERSFQNLFFFFIINFTFEAQEIYKKIILAFFPSRIPSSVSASRFLLAEVLYFPDHV